MVQAVATHLIYLYKDEELVIGQIDLMAGTNDGCDLLDNAVAGQDVVVAYRGSNCKLCKEGTMSGLGVERIICEEACTRSVPSASQRVLGGNVVGEPP